jgi:hypothetical protein
VRITVSTSQFASFASAITNGSRNSGTANTTCIWTFSSPRIHRATCRASRFRLIIDTLRFPEIRFRHRGAHLRNDAMRASVGFWQSGHMDHLHPQEGLNRRLDQLNRAVLMAQTLEELSRHLLASHERANQLAALLVTDRLYRREFFGTATHE